jgi:hypothetical protein
MHRLVVDDARVFEDIGGLQPWRELLAALEQKLGPGSGGK